MEQKEEENTLRWKCFSCKHIIHDKDLKNDCCPVCGESKNGVLVPMCPADVIEHPKDTIEEGVRYCKICGRPIASNGSHSVSVLSRITGYVSEAYTESPYYNGSPYDGSAWNNGKFAEFKDRRRENNVEKEVTK